MKKLYAFELDLSIGPARATRDGREVVSVSVDGVEVDVRDLSDADARLLALRVEFILGPLTERDHDRAYESWRDERDMRRAEGA